ncbi:hypothetical protein [Gorillibacterium sp. sgz500922]|uniref:hypothetical protein n=1 Tax=Gorillibacterium sp. sgz500922 TaxID=3446694 RepID=UPI003F6778E5
MYKGDKMRINGVLLFIMTIFYMSSIPFLLLRYYLHRNLSYHNVKDWRLTGTLLFLMSLLFLSYGGRYLDTPLGNGFTAMFFVCLVGGIYCKVRGRRATRRLGDRYDRYGVLLMQEKVTSISDLAAEVGGLNKQRVENDLLRMREHGLLPNFSIFGGRVQFHYPPANEPVYSQPVHTGYSQPDDQPWNEDEPEPGAVSMLLAAALQGVENGIKQMKEQKQRPLPQPMVVQCPGCGSGTLLQPGESRACPYCGSPLTYAQGK